MGKDTQNTENDVAAMQVAITEVLDALRPLNTEAQLRILASVATFLGLPEQLRRKLA